jgi:3-mercaptopyruvate sulfurtransferase SseA
MKLTLLMSALCSLAILLGCQSTSSNTKIDNSSANSSAKTETADEAPRINLEEAKKDFDAGIAVFVDTRAETEFAREHIKGAINIPASTAATRWKEIPTNKKIIAYCS